MSEPRTHVLLALVSLHERQGRATVREVALLAGRSVSATHKQLLALRADGLVECGESGRLRPLVRVVAHTPEGRESRTCSMLGSSAHTSGPRGASTPGDPADTYMKEGVDNG